MDATAIALFNEVADRSPAEREAIYANRQVPAALRDEVESLLRFDAAPGRSLEAYVGAAEASLAHADVLPSGSRFGSYRLVRIIGSGGMGTVYEAEQDNPHRTVALKVVRAGVASAEAARRFKHEAETLGRLQHPGIAQVYEAGTADTPIGPQPYFAMEYVRGEPLLRYAEVHGLGTRQRLELFARICEAVHHAHQRGIIHRDLKPDNILVDESGQPKILDFGVARITDSDIQVTRHTHAGELIGTLAYMSPEQVSADPLDVDTRSDVYALGVILYELLAKRLPYETGGKLHEVVRAIREDDPAPLGSINRMYRGDVETIVAKALEKEKARRYGSATALSEDIRRYLQDEPIVARRPSTAYQLQKFARRNKAVVAGVAAVFAALVAGIVASTWQAARALRAERAAAAETATAKAVSDFLQNDLLAKASAAGQAKPGTKPDPDLKVRTALDRAAATISGKFDQQPLIAASIRTTIGDTYHELGLYKEAQQQYEQAIDVRRRELGAEHPETLSAVRRLATMQITLGRYRDAEPLAVSVMEAQRRVLGEDNPETLDSTFTVADVYRMERKTAQAEALLVRLIPAQRRVKGADHRDTLDSRHLLAIIYRLEGKYDQAAALLQEVLAARRRVEGDEHPDTLDTINDLVVLYDAMGQYAKAQELAPGLVDAEQRVLGQEHDKTITGMYELGILDFREGQYAQAESLITRALDLKRQLLGEVSGPTLTMKGTLALLYVEEGKLTQAQTLITEVIEARTRLLGAENPETLISLNTLALVTASRGDVAAAETQLRNVRDTRLKVLGTEHFATLATTSDLGNLYLKQARPHDAEPLLTDALAGRRRALGDDHPDTLTTMTGLAEAFVQERRYADAAPLATEALNRFRKTRPDNWRRYKAESLLGTVLTGEGKFGDAEPLLISGQRGLADRAATIPAGDRAILERSAVAVLELYRASGQADKAAAWAAKIGAPPKAATPH